MNYLELEKELRGECRKSLRHYAEKIAAWKRKSTVMEKVKLMGAYQVVINDLFWGVIV